MSTFDGVNFGKLSLISLMSDQEENMNIKYHWPPWYLMEEEFNISLTDSKYFLRKSHTSVFVSDVRWGRKDLDDHSPSFIQDKLLAHLRVYRDQIVTQLRWFVQDLLFCFLLFTESILSLLNNVCPFVSPAGEQIVKLSFKRSIWHSTTYLPPLTNSDPSLCAIYIVAGPLCAILGSKSAVPTSQMPTMCLTSRLLSFLQGFRIHEPLIINQGSNAE